MAKLNYKAKAQTDIKNALECIKKEPLTIETAENIYNVAQDLLHGLREDYREDPINEGLRETIAYAGDFMWAAEKLADALRGFSDLERDFINY